MPANNPPLKRPAKKPLEMTSAEEAVVAKGFDTPKPATGKTRNFGVPLSEDEHILLAKLEKAITAEMAAMGGKTSRRTLTRQWLVERMRSEAAKRDLD